MVSETQTLYLRDTLLTKWIVRVRFPESDGPNKILVMLHGWTGDENSMWVFASRIPKSYLILAPRGIYKSPGGGYGWHPHSGDLWPTVKDFYPAVEALRELLTPERFPIRSVGQSALNNISLIGFSQGAALMYVFCLMNSLKIRKFAGLSGFLPDNLEEVVKNNNFAGTPAFIAHGSDDRVVLVDNAHRAVDFFRNRGAEVTYCEDSVGHKLSRNCFMGLEKFFFHE